MDVDDICEVNDKLLEECMHYIERAGRVGNRPGTVKELTEQERPRLRPLPAKRYEVGVHGKATVSNQQLFKFDGFVYSAPRPCAGKEIGIIAYSFRVELYHRGARVWECSRPLFESENRVYAEHFIFDLDIKPRARENAFPLLEGILPPELDRFRKLCKSRTTKCHQLYMLMKKMEEVGREALLKAVDIANAAGSPTLAKVEALLHPGPGGPSGGGEPGMAELEDDFHVELRDPADYAALLGGD